MSCWESTGGTGKVASLDARAVPLVAVFVVLSRVPGPLVRVHLVGAAVHARTDVHLIEDEEFIFRTEERRIGNAGGLEVGLGTLRQGARITLIALHRHRLDDVAAQVDGRFLVERINDGGGRVGHQDHVRLVDALPTGNR